MLKKKASSLLPFRGLLRAGWLSPWLDACATRVHDLSPCHTLLLARALGRLPPRLLPVAAAAGVVPGAAAGNRAVAAAETGAGARNWVTERACESQSLFSLVVRRWVEARVLIKRRVSERRSLWFFLWCEERWFEDIGQSVDQRACE